MSTPYGVEGCICWADQDGDGWYPNAACPYHGVLADFTPDRRDTGTYRVAWGAMPQYAPPEVDPADGCGYHQEGRDCEYHGPLPLHIITTEQEQDDRPGVLAAIRRWVARLVYGRAHDVDGW